MSFFIDRFNRRKSPLALAAFGAALLDLAVFGLLYAFLAKPLYDTISLGGTAATVVVHALIIAVLGTAICCLLFLLKDKRVAPYGFLGLTVLLLVFYAVAFLLEEDARPLMLYLITLYGLAPVLVGNAVTWPIYLKIKRANPALNHRKTIAEELREAVEKENAGKTARQEPTETKRPAPEPTETKHPAPEPPATVEEAMFGLQADRSAFASRSAQEEAMLLYEDDEDEEESDD